MAEKYSVPPIIECVVEFRFSSPTTFDAIKKRETKLKRHYPDVTSSNFSVTANITDKGVSGTHDLVGLKFATFDQLQVMSVNVDLLTVAQLAPYPGWDVFRERVKRDLALYFDQFGRRQISRIGVRYINRIDVDASTAHVEQYLNVYPTLPLRETLGVSFALQSTHRLSDQRYFVTLQSATVESPVPKMLSFLLDIDLFRTDDLPSRDEQIFELLEEMRTLKNSIFESSITDAARKLFK